MKAQIRQTPCLGVCSTTYGDLVCRGCKRFSHEVTGWNGYAADQKNRIWARLEALRDQCVAIILRVDNQDALKNFVLINNIPVWNCSSNLSLAYQVLRFHARGKSAADYQRTTLAKYLHDLGLKFDSSSEHAQFVDLNCTVDNFQMLCTYIDDEFYTRSKAYYERNFKTPLQGQVK